MKRDDSPTIIAIAAVTIDGKIALHENQQSDWTSPEDKQALRGLLDETDIIAIGHKTYLIHEERLAERKCIVFTRTVTELKQQSKNVLLCNLDNVSPREVLSPYRLVALLGGGQMYTHFLEHDLIDELQLTIEPIVFGNGLNLFEGSPSSIRRPQLVSIRELNQHGTVLLHYRKLR
jgi:dihydrofolate reductase